MINKILLNKKLPFPHISFSLILSCLIISVPIIFNDVLYAFLGSNVGLAFPWQYLTSIFTHGPEPPTIIHLLINLSIIVFCVAFTEKLLGTWRVFFMIVLTTLVLTFIRFETYNFYNGISSFIFALAPFTLVIWLKEFKNHRKQFWSDVYSILTLLVLFTVFFLYPIYYSFSDSIFSERNIFHLISTIIGVFFLLLWKKRIFETLNEINQEGLQKRKPILVDKISRTLGYLITVINFLVLLIVLIFFD